MDAISDARIGNAITLRYFVEYVDFTYISYLYATQYHQFNYSLCYILFWTLWILFYLYALLNIIISTNTFLDSFRL